MATALEGINIKRDFQVDNGAHILYVFEDQEPYIDNLVSYVTDGLTLGHTVLVVDYVDVYNSVMERLSVRFSEDDLQRVYFRDCRSFYGANTCFHAESILEHFDGSLGQLPQSGSAFLTWGRVVWEEQSDIVEKIIEYERMADSQIKDQPVVSVCAYDAEAIDGNFVLKLLRNHDYLMTDNEMVRSQLYVPNKVAFPSLAVQSKIESELDLYKSKLDFAHVVSHEVRNPLTIIDGYARMIRSREQNLSRDSVDKLVSIGHYVAAIDQELSHIIETEQVLAEDLYMSLDPMDATDTIRHVIELMKVKSIVQNVDFQWSLDPNPRYLMLGNRMGLRLILSNVISNAIKYTDERGTVEFNTGVTNHNIRFVIRDNGVGMSPGQLDSLFQKYAKFNESKSGQGIGLYVVKNLTDRFKGELYYESELGRGTTVTIEFPLLARG